MAASAFSNHPGSSRRSATLSGALGSFQGRPVPAAQALRSVSQPAGCAPAPGPCAARLGEEEEFLSPLISSISSGAPRAGGECAGAHGVVRCRALSARTACKARDLADLEKRRSHPGIATVPLSASITNQPTFSTSCQNDSSPPQTRPSSRTVIREVPSDELSEAQPQSITSRPTTWSTGRPVASTSSSTSGFWGRHTSYGIHSPAIGGLLLLSNPWTQHTVNRLLGIKCPRHRELAPFFAVQNDFLSP